MGALTGSKTGEGPQVNEGFKPYIRKPRVWFEDEVRAAIRAVAARKATPGGLSFDDYVALHDPWTEPHEDLVVAFGFRSAVKPHRTDLWKKGVL